MNKIYRTIDEIHMDEEKKRKIRENLADEYERMEGKHMRQKRKITWKAAVATLGIVAVLGASTAVVGAGFGFDVNKHFENFLGLNKKEDKKLHEEKVIQEPRISDTHKGFSVEAEKLISTGKECFVWLKITAPKDKRPLTNPVSFGKFDESGDTGFDFYQNGKKVEKTEVTYVYNGQEPDDSDEPWNTIVWQPEKGITYEKIKLGRAAGEETWDGATLQIKCHSLRYNDEVIDAESVWNLEIPVEVSDKAAEYELQYTCPLSDKNVVNTGLKKISVTKVTVHPFGIALEFQCPDQWKQEWKNDPDAAMFAAIGRISGYEYKDGSVVKFNIDENSYPIVEVKDDGKCEISEMYYERIDVGNIKAVYLDGERIPLK